MPLLFLVTILGPDNQGSLLGGLLQAFAQAVLVIAAIALVGTVVLRPLFRLVASADSTELFVAAALLVAVGSGLVTAAAGLSMALGAFVAGLLLAETEYHRAIEATIDPFKGLLLGVFFFSVGMSLDLALLLANPLPIVAGIVGLIAIKARRADRAAAPVPRALAGDDRDGAAARRPAASSPSSSSGSRWPRTSSRPSMGAIVLAITSFSMALVPVLDYLGRRWREQARGQAGAEPGAHACRRRRSASTPSSSAAAASARLVSEMLTRHEVKHIIVEKDPGVVARCRAEGLPVYFGDAKNPLFLKRCGIEQAKGVVITVNKPSAVDEIVTRGARAARRHRHRRARARRRARAPALQARRDRRGAGDDRGEPAAVARRRSSGSACRPGPVIASIHEKRDEFREALQGAAGRPTRGLRASQLKRIEVALRRHVSGALTLAASDRSDDCRF